MEEKRATDRWHVPVDWLRAWWYTGACQSRVAIMGFTNAGAGEKPPLKSSLLQVLKMPEKELQNITTQTWLVQALPFLMALALSCVGGLVSYLNRIDKSGVAFSFFRLSIEIITSGFVGIISFMLCDYAGLEWSATAAIVAISGHMGTRALFLIENAAVKIAENFIEGKTNGNRKRKTEAAKQAD